MFAKSFCCAAVVAVVLSVSADVRFSARTLPAVEGVRATVDVKGEGDVWRLAVSATNGTATNVTLKVALAADAPFVATRYLIPGVLYNGNEFVGKSIPSDGRSFSLDMPSGWEKDGEPWVFAGDRCSIPSCTISENAGEAFALFASDADPKSLTSSCSLEKRSDGSFRHLIYWPVTEAPVSYTDKRTFTPRYDTYLTLTPGETFRADAFACRGTPPWPNYGFACVFPQAWRLLKHETKAQKTVAETIRLDRAYHRWSWRRNAQGSWFAGGHNDKTFGMGYGNIPKSKEGHTLADYERDFTLDRWLNDDVEKSKRLKPGELIESAGAKDIGFASQSFQKARVTIAYGLADGNEEEVAFGLEVLRSWIRVRQQPSGFFSRAHPRKDGRTFTDASEIGWAISELSRTAQLLERHGRDGREFRDAAKRVVDALMKALPEGGGLGSTWDFKTGELLSSAGDCGGFVLMGLVRYWQMTKDAAVRAAIDAAFDYYFSRDIDRFECNGGAMDCSSVDREGIQPFLSATVEMWRATREDRYLERARKAGWYFLSWLYQQNPTYGPDLDLSVYNWRPAGSTIVGTEHPGLDDYGGLLIPELMTLATTDASALWREVAGLIWRNGTQGFAFEGREVWHSLERPIGSKQEAWFPTRWSKYRTGENKRGSLNDHLMSWGGTYRLAALLELADDDRAWLEESSPVATEVTLSNRFGTARVELRGANLRSWRPTGGREVLGRQGIAACWPWANYEGAIGCAIHGLTPYFDWQVREASSDRVVLVLEDCDATRRIWPHRFRAEMTYRLGEKLETEFRVTNTDDAPYACTELLKSFVAVSHPKNCTVERGDGAYTLVDRDRQVTANFKGGDKFVTDVASDGAVSMGKGAISRDRAYTLKPGETHALKLSISSAEPCTLHLAGDSTLAWRRPDESSGSWGEALRSKLCSSARIRNYAIAGRSTVTFRPQWETNLIGRVKKGDHVLIQFGHNDPCHSPKKLLDREGCDRFCTVETFRANLTRYVREAQAKGAKVLLLTPTPQRAFFGGTEWKLSRNHVPYFAVIPEVARETGADFIDMTALGSEIVKAMGVEGSRSFYRVNANGRPDDIHPNKVGAKRLADLFLSEVKRRRLSVGELFMCDGQAWTPSAPHRKSPFAPIMTKPGELDFIRSHIQGIALTDDVIYLSHAEGLVKIDWTGNVITNVEARRHMGDIEVVDGLVYGALGKTKNPHKGLGGTAFVTTFRADDLAHVGEDTCLRQVAPGIDGIAYLNGFFYVGGGRLGGKDSPVRNLVVKLDRDLKPVKSANLDRGWKTKTGVQDVAAVDGEIYLFFYPKSPTDPSCVVVDEDLNWLRTVDLWGGNGVKALPPRFGKSKYPRFLVCRTHGVSGTDDRPLQAELRFVEIRGEKTVDLYDAGL